MSYKTPKGAEMLDLSKGWASSLLEEHFLVSYGQLWQKPYDRQGRRSGNYTFILGSEKRDGKWSTSQAFCRAEDGIIWAFNVNPKTKKLEPWKTTYPHPSDSPGDEMRVSPTMMAVLIPSNATNAGTGWMGKAASDAQKRLASRLFPEQARSQDWDNNLTKGAAQAIGAFADRRIVAQLDEMMARYKPRTQQQLKEMGYENARTHGMETLRHYSLEM